MTGFRDLPRTFGDYRLERILGTGSITTAYLATRTRTGARVVLKQIHAYLLEQQEEVDLFLSEAQVLVALDHPKIGRILDVGLVGRVPYLSLEFLSGRDLTEVLLARESGEKRPLPLSLALFVARSVAAALAHAHGAQDEQGRALRIVHRDVSPNNVILCFDGNVKLVDFGIARSALRATRTTVGMIRGTPGYMSPEQLRADVIDGRSDVFVLGTLLYRMIAGRPAFPVVSGELDSYRRPLTDEAPPLHLLRPEVSETLSLLVAKAMHKDVIERVESAAAFERALGDLLHTEADPVGEAQVADLMAWLFPEAAELSEQQMALPPQAGVIDDEKALSYVRDDPGVALPDFGEADSLEATEAGASSFFFAPEVTDPHHRGDLGGRRDDADTLFEDAEGEATPFAPRPSTRFDAASPPPHPPTLDAPPPQMTPPATPALRAGPRGRGGVTIARRAGDRSKRSAIFGAIGIVAGLVLLTVLVGMIFGS